MNSIKWILEVVGNKKSGIALLSIFQIVLGAAAVWFALLLRDMIDASVSGDRVGLVHSSLFLVSVVVLQLVLRSLSRYLEEVNRAVLENCFKERLFTVLMNRDYAAVMAVHSGDWMNRLTSDSAVIADVLVQVLPGSVGMLVKMAGAVIMIMILLPWMGAVLVPAGILMILFTQGFRKRLKRMHKDIQEKDGRLRMFLQERLGSMIMVRTYAKEETTIVSAGVKMKEHKNARKRRGCFHAICNIGFSGAMNGIYLIGAVYCCMGIMKGMVTYGTLMTVLQLINQVQAPMANISGFVPRFYAMLASAERLMEAETFPADCPEEKKCLDEVGVFYAQNFSEICLHDAEFTYLPPVCEVQPDGWNSEKQNMPVVFKNVNLQIKKGDYTAITGQSGSGKSTILKLIMCLYSLDKGERWLVDQNGNAMPLTRAWQKLFAYVPQGNQLMSGTIREVIAFGENDKMYDEMRMRRAIEIACADEFIDRLEEGLDTLLGERGTGLSEGQMQRIAIARAVFSEHPILILDEATSALDDVTESRLLKKLQSMTDKTVLIVTHRRAALEICNRHILVSENGIIVEDMENEKGNS